MAEKTGSSALATDAFHFASDIWSSLAVLGGLGACWAGVHFGVGWLLYADPLAAVVVSLMILRLTLRLGREAVSVLLDEIPVETRFDASSIFHIGTDVCSGRNSRSPCLRMKRTYT